MAEASAYAILGLQKGASDEEIKRAYIELVKKFDPERHTERFMVIQAAFNRLRDVEERAREDIHTLNLIKCDYIFTPEEIASDSEPPDDEAVETARTAYRSFPTDSAARERLVGLLFKHARAKTVRKQWPEAIKDWMEVLDIDASNHRARQNLFNGYLTLGTSYALHGLEEEAVSIWESAVQINPDNDRLLHNLALTAEKLNNHGLAGKYWAETVKRWTQKMDAGGEDSDYMRFCIIEAHRHHGGLIEAGENEGRVSHVAVPMPSQVNVQRQSSSSSQSSVPSAPPPSAEVHNRAVVDTVHSIISRCKKVLELNPKDSDARFQLVHALMEAQQWDVALIQLEELAKLHPRSTEVLNLKGWTLLNAGQVDNAFTMWGRALTLDPKDPRIKESMVRARLLVGKQMRDKGLFTHALVHFKNLGRLLPQSAEVHLEIAATYDMKGDVRSAMAEYQQVLSIDPKNKLARKALGDLKMKR